MEQPNRRKGPDRADGGDDEPLRILVVTGGHRVDLDALLEMVSAVCTERGWVWAHVVQPDAQRWLSPRLRNSWDAILCHDIPGLELSRGRPPRPLGPDAETARALTQLLEHGQGLVVTHHALSGWPGWPGWADAIGGRFLYAPGVLRGRSWPSSGYRHDSYRVQVVAREHPVCAGVDDFVVDDELYGCPVFEDEVVPLLRTDADLSPSTLISTYEQVLDGESVPMDPSAPPASDLLGWATAAGRSPLVYLLPGDSGSTFGLPPYRRLLGNALAWVASDDGHLWARRRRHPIDATVPAQETSAQETSAQDAPARELPEPVATTTGTVPTTEQSR